MKTTFAFVALCLTATSAFAAEGTFSRNLKVSGAPTISIGTDSGYIHVTTGPQSEVRLSAKVRSEHGWTFNSHGSDSDRVRDIASNPPIVQNGDAITIGPSGGDNSRFRNIEIDYDVTLPASTTLKVGTGSGDIDVANVMTLLSATTGSGDIRLNNVGAIPHVSTGSGSIRAQGVHGAANFETGSGDIEIQQDQPGDVKAETGSGSMRLHGLNGGLRAVSGSGDLEIDGRPAADWKVTTGSGSVRLNTSADAHYSLNASTSSGSVAVSAPISMQASFNKQHVVGSVRGGGPTVKVSTASGDITIH